MVKPQVSLCFDALVGLRRVFSEAKRTEQWLVSLGRQFVMAEAFFMYVNSWHWQRCSEPHGSGSVFIWVSGFVFGIHGTQQNCTMILKKYVKCKRKNHQGNWLFKNKFWISFSSTLPLPFTYFEICYQGRYNFFAKCSVLSIQIQHFFQC